MSKIVDPKFQNVADGAKALIDSFETAKATKISEVTAIIDAEYAEKLVGYKEIIAEKDTKLAEAKNTIDEEYDKDINKAQELYNSVLIDDPTPSETEVSTETIEIPKE